jgi:hypothetical protein
VADPRARVINRRGSGHSSGRGRVKWVILLLFAATAVITWQFARRQSGPDLSYSSSNMVPFASQESKTAESLGFPSRPNSFIRGENRLVYPYSVIPGGIRSVADLKLAIAEDPVVSQQFQGFNFDKAHLVQVAQREPLFVSYRVGQKVYWTRRKLALHPGETLVTDGNITARTRCGNRVAKVPLNAGSPVEPPEEAFNQPYAALIAAPTTDPVNADPGPIPLLPTSAVKKSRRWWVLPLFAAPLAALPHSDHFSDSPLAVTPEPGMSLLLISGLAGVYWRARKLRRKD